MLPLRDTIPFINDVKLHIKANVPHQVHRDVARDFFLSPLNPEMGLLGHMFIMNSSVTEGRERHNIDEWKEEREAVDSFCQQGLQSKSQMEAPSSSIVKNVGMYELNYELIFSSIGAESESSVREQRAVSLGLGFAMVLGHNRCTAAISMIALVISESTDSDKPN
ncbi:hypothetical protein Acr_00g0080570 [Actinidia rufa]|uniref:Uncharacterized protein n=1 Tax=Actinidia rufa TaxID=165716 RepID=A0A7J0DUP1_9ERIC|nr:hypothetical protein Acr_00g0080570 [Actinidia rufa]